MARRASLLLKEQFSDVSVKVRGRDGYTWRFPAHSLILRDSSDWFGEVLDEQLLISRERLSITFIDVPHEAVVHLLRFIYTEELPFFRSAYAILDLLKLSVQCRLLNLQQRCESKLMSAVTVRNACSLLEKSCALLNSGYGSTILVEACRRFVLGYGQIIFSSELVYELSEKNMREILQSNELNLVDEDTVFSGLWSWGHRHCCRSGVEITKQNIIDCLATILPHVRFSFLKNPTILPDVVLDKYCKCLEKESYENACCFRDDKPKIVPRQPYRQHRDLLRQSSRCSLFDNLKSWDSVAGISRLLCIQVSFDEDVFLVSADVAVIAGQQLSSESSLVLSVIAEDSGIELHREDVHWDESRAYGRDQMISSSLRFKRPVPIFRRCFYSLYLILPSTDCDDGWRFPSTTITRRRHLMVTEEGPITVTTHSDKAQAIPSIYVLAAGQHI